MRKLHLEGSPSALGYLLRPEHVCFDQTPVVCFDSTGATYTRWVRVGMPKLGKNQFLLDTTFFLYPSANAAEKGVSAGGTGFLVGIPSETDPTKFYAYAVTNWHVALGTSKSVPCPVIRLNRKAGPPAVRTHDPSEWFFVGGTNDVAVLPIDLNDTTLKIGVMDAKSFFLLPDQVKEFEVSAGEDVFMIGRFIDYDGVEANTPSMRFGNISMMAAKVKQPTGYVGDSLVVDMHSRTGYSGSPVFMYRTPGAFLDGEPGQIVLGGYLLKVLGILWGQFPEEWDLQDKDKDMSQAATPPVLTGKSIKGMSGMSLVCPASAIMELLNMPQLKAIRAAHDSTLKSQAKNLPEPQVSDHQPTDENPTHREDFMRLQDVAARKRTQGG